MFLLFTRIIVSPFISFLHSLFMPKTIDYPRTSYTSAWEVAEVVDDTGGKCALETAARKLNRKVSGSFKAIVGSAVKFGLLTSKRELLTTTNLFRRIKHAYDKQEEKIYHREAFLHPPLFMQICRKFRNRELPVHMFDVMLIREFGVEEINAQGVAKAFVEGARMVDLIDERNIIADIDQLSAQQGPRRELAAGEMPLNSFRRATDSNPELAQPALQPSVQPPAHKPINSLPSSPGFVLADSSLPEEPDPISALFNLPRNTGIQATQESVSLVDVQPSVSKQQPPQPSDRNLAPPILPNGINPPIPTQSPEPSTSTPEVIFRLQISGPSLHTDLTIQDPSDLLLVHSLLEKIKRQLGGAA
ncbi:hypothetical protein HER32_00730 [Hymenobacter sp. BT18]|uniref:hypothetical protein n=1 Tax=Hymenobacter sp. BT18 TaxID=2835648 RepID=UPI00143EE4BE|nr:hypothetical protein [Hymenobacter sp. BT18]QIX59793.1 hypothetical protein HER32_00730 [Hymenobacter sp. BT18]